MTKINILAIRTRTGMTQEAMARAAGVTRRTYCNWEKDNSETFSAAIHYLALILDSHPHFVLKPRTKGLS